MSPGLLGGQLSRCPALHTPLWKRGVGCRLARGGSELTQALSSEVLHILERPSGNQECPSGSRGQDFGRGLQHAPGPGSNMLSSAVRRCRDTGPSPPSGTRCLGCVPTSQPVSPVVGTSLFHSGLHPLPKDTPGITPGSLKSQSAGKSNPVPPKFHPKRVV